MVLDGLSLQCPPLVFPPLFSVFCSLPVSLCFASPLVPLRRAPFQPCCLHSVVASDASSTLWSLPMPFFDRMSAWLTRGVSSVAMLPLMTCEALTQAYRAMLPDEYLSPLRPKELQSRLLRGGGAPQNPLHSNRQMMTLVVGALLLVAFSRRLDLIGWHDCYDNWRLLALSRSA